MTSGPGGHGYTDHCPFGAAPFAAPLSHYGTLPPALRPARLVVLGFSLDDPSSIEQVRAVARTLKFPNGLLGSDRLAGYGRIWRIPVNFTIDRGAGPTTPGMIATRRGRRSGSSELCSRCCNGSVMRHR